MTFALWMILAAAVLPYLAVGYAKYDPKFDNHAPRKFLEKQTGAKQRAYWAQNNSFEVFPLFAAAVIIAHITDADQAEADMLAGGFVLSRVIYIIAYIADWATFRSVVWAVGFGFITGLFLIAA